MHVCMDIIVKFYEKLSLFLWRQWTMVCCIFCGSDAEICVSYKIDSTCMNFFENASLGGSKVSKRRCALAVEHS